MNRFEIKNADHENSNINNCFLSFSVPTTPPLTEKCEDSPAIAHCSVVRQVNFCCINFYKKACCKTCEDLFPTCDL